MVFSFKCFQLLNIRFISVSISQSQISVSVFNCCVSQCRTSLPRGLNTPQGAGSAAPRVIQAPAQASCRPPPDGPIGSAGGPVAGLCPDCPRRGVLPGLRSPAWRWPSGRGSSVRPAAACSSARRRKPRAHANPCRV